MSLSQKGAGYINREHFKDGWHRASMDDLASQLQAIRAQGNFGRNGKIDAPTPPTLLNVVASGGLFSVSITHASPPPGVVYRVQYDTTPNFTDPQPIDLGEVLKTQRYLPGAKLYWRAAVKYPSSELSKWIYFGSQVAPTKVG